MSEKLCVRLSLSHRGFGLEIFFFGWWWGGVRSPKLMSSRREKPSSPALLILGGLNPPAFVRLITSVFGGRRAVNIRCLPGIPRPVRCLPIPRPRPLFVPRTLISTFSLHFAPSAPPFSLYICLHLCLSLASPFCLLPPEETVSRVVAAEAFSFHVSHMSFR